VTVVQYTYAHKQYRQRHKTNNTQNKTNYIEQHKKYIENTKIRKRAGRALSLRVLPWHLPYN